MLYRSMKPVRGRWHGAGSRLIVAVALLLAGCATERPTLALGVGSVANASFVLLDQRPRDERTTKWLSSVVYTCAFNVRQYGDDAVLPDRFALLADTLNATLHERLAGKSVRVAHFALYLNSSQRSRAAQSIRGDGLVQSLSDYAMVDRFDHLCTAEEMAAGWRDPGDPDTTHPVVIARITLVVEGRTYSVRSFEKASSPGLPAAMIRAIRKAADRISADIVATPGVTTAARDEGHVRP